MKHLTQTLIRTALCAVAAVLAASLTLTTAVSAVQAAPVVALHR